MRLISTLFVFIQALLASQGATAATAFTGEIIETRLDSTALNERREIIVRLPLDYRLQNEARYPVLYLLDGGIQTSHTTGTISYLHEYYQIPDMIVVAIRNTDRSRDMTPTPNERFETAGGAPQFLRFIESELMPHIERNYRTAGYNMIAGHSFGGLFVFYTLLERPDLFQARFAFSPSLWWYPDTYFPALREFLATNPDFRSFLYTNLGNEGEIMEPAFTRLQNLLAASAPAGLTWHARNMPDDVHVTTPVVGQFEALRLLFSDWPLQPEVAATGRTNVLSHYEKLSEQFGYSLAPDERLLNAVANQLFSFRGEPARARELLYISLDTYPDSPHAYALMAALELQDGNVDGALEWIDEALTRIDPGNRYFERYDAQREDILDAISDPTTD